MSIHIVSVLERMLGHDCNSSMHYAIGFLLLSRDYVLKFDWYYQLSGSGTNSLNSRNLPGHFSYDVGMRLTSNLEKSDGLVHCSVENAVVLCESHHERVTQI